MLSTISMWLQVLNHSQTSGHWSLSWGGYSTAPLRMSQRSYNQLWVVGFRLGGNRIYILSGCIQISSKGIGRIPKKALQLFMLNSKRLGGYTQWVHFARKAHTTRRLQEHFMSSLWRYSDATWFYSAKSRRFKTTSKINHEELGGLTNLDPMGSLLDRLLRGFLGQPKVCLKTRNKVAWSPSIQELT